MVPNKHIETSSLPQIDYKMVDLLMQQYQVLKQDSLTQVASYKNHVRNTQIAFTTVIAISSFISTTGNYSIVDANKYIWVGVVAIITTVSYYLIHDVLESVFAAKALEEYLSFLEVRINKLTSQNSFLWQSSVADQLWPLSESIKDIKTPIKFIELYQSIIILGVTVLFPLYIYYKIIVTTQLDIVLIFCLLELGLYLIYSAYAATCVWKDINTKLRKEVRNLIRQGVYDISL